MLQTHTYKIYIFNKNKYNLNNMTKKEQIKILFDFLSQGKICFPSPAKTKMADSVKKVYFESKLRC